jgi:ankyrin repeat protein
MIELLISKGARHDVREKFGSFPLHLMASHHGQKDAAACLLDHGADINASYDMDTIPLLLAAVHSHFEAVKFLVLKVSDFKAASENECAPLEAAANYGHCVIW